jgi:hypothetical protein
MASATHVKAIAAWLTGLANACAGNAPLADAASKIAEMSKMLAEEFPDDAVFTDASKRFVAGQCHLFPSFGKCRDFLHVWWKENCPRTSDGLPDDLESAKLPSRDRLMVGLWMRKYALSENRKRLDDWNATAWPKQRDNPELDDVTPPIDELAPSLAVDLSLLRRHARAGYRWLVEHNASAASTQSKMGWRGAEEQHKGPRTDEELEAIAAIVRRRFPSVTDGAGHAVPSGAPRPPDPAHQRLIADQVQEHAGRPLGALTPEALEEARRRANSPLAGRTANGVPVAKPAPAEEPPPAPPPTPEEQPFKFAWC